MCGLACVCRRACVHLHVRERVCTITDAYLHKVPVFVSETCNVTCVQMLLLVICLRSFYSGNSTHDRCFKRIDILLVVVEFVVLGSNVV